jgi:hypothetical protein
MGELQRLAGHVDQRLIAKDVFDVERVDICPAGQFAAVTALVPVVK